MGKAENPTRVGITNNNCIMKTLRKFILPAVVVIFGAGSAFATNLNKNAHKAVKDGYVFRPGELEECQNTHISCSDTGSVICTANVGMGTENLRDLSGTSCPNNLFEIPQN